MAYIRLKFPCGLEIESKALFVHLNSDDVSKIYLDGCPLHKKACINIR